MTPNGPANFRPQAQALSHIAPMDIDSIGVVASITTSPYESNRDAGDDDTWRWMPRPSH